MCMNHTHTHTVNITTDGICVYAQMEKVKARARAWEAEFQRTCLPMKVTVIGCLWMGEKGGGGAEREREREFLRQFSAMTLVSTPVDVEVLNSASPQNSSSEERGRAGGEDMGRGVKKM